MGVYTSVSTAIAFFPFENIAQGPFNGASAPEGGTPTARRVIRAEYTWGDDDSTVRYTSIYILQGTDQRSTRGSG